MSQKILIVLLTLSFCFKLFSFEPISVTDGYCSGIIKVTQPYWDGGTFAFSNGLELTSFDLQSPNAMHYSFTMGYFPNDSAYQVPYESNIFDTSWNEALELPADLEPCVIWSAYIDPNDLQNDELVPAICRFSRSGSELPAFFITYSEYYSSELFYVKCKDGRNFKFQIVDVSFYSYTDGPYDETITEIDGYSIRWSADSAGNGKFQQSSPIIETKSYKQLDLPYTYSLSKSTLAIESTFSKPLSVELCTMNGQIVRSAWGSNICFKLEGLAKGAYLMRCRKDGKSYTDKLILQ